ncbi:hypothetical protein K1719_018714 [Acacia pycnantha]|nr:hypothetical protein K1719_018714 [Acacia pycnantha]
MFRDHPLATGLEAIFSSEHVEDDIVLRVCERKSKKKAQQSKASGVKTESGAKTVGGTSSRAGERSSALAKGTSQWRMNLNQKLERSSEVWAITANNGKIGSKGF